MFKVDRLPPPWRWALLVFLLGNLWLGARLDVLLQDEDVGELGVLDAKLRAIPAERVEVLVVGNSHSLAGLRPPQLAAAWSLGPDAVFSLALPGASLAEAHLLLARYRDRFPRLRLVLVGVDAYLLSGGQPARLRRLTHLCPLERFRTTAHLDAEGRLREVVGSCIPALDFGPGLREAFLAHPRLSVRALVQSVPRYNPTYNLALAHAFRWGLPPPWDYELPGYLLQLKRESLLPATLRGRAGAMGLNEAAARANVGRLASLVRELGAVRLALIELPFAREFADAQERAQPGAVRRWWALIEERPELASVPRVAAPAVPLSQFIDADHLAPTGAAQLARHVAARLTHEGQLRADGGTGP